MNRPPIPHDQMGSACPERAKPHRAQVATVPTRSGETPIGDRGAVVGCGDAAKIKRRDSNSLTGSSSGLKGLVRCPIRNPSTKCTSWKRLRTSRLRAGDVNASCPCRDRRFTQLFTVVANSPSRHSWSSQDPKHPPSALENWDCQVRATACRTFVEHMAKMGGMPASIGFRPTQDDERILREVAQPGESTSDTLRRALRLLDHERWLGQFRVDAEALKDEDVNAEPEAW